MRKCITCHQDLPFFTLDNEHKECQKKRMDIWVGNHTFVFGEKVAINSDDFHLEKREGIVVDKGEDVVGAWGYYSSSEWYKVEDVDGRITKFAPEQLSKLSKL